MTLNRPKIALTSTFHTSAQGTGGFYGRSLLAWVERLDLKRGVIVIGSRYLHSIKATENCCPSATFLWVLGVAVD